MQLDEYDVTCIVTTMTRYLRELPDPVIPEQHYFRFVEAASKCHFYRLGLRLDKLGVVLSLFGVTL